MAQHYKNTDCETKSIRNAVITIIVTLGLIATLSIISMIIHPKFFDSIFNALTGNASSSDDKFIESEPNYNGKTPEETTAFVETTIPNTVPATVICSEEKVEATTITVNSNNNTVTSSPEMIVEQSGRKTLNEVFISDSKRAKVIQTSEEKITSAGKSYQKLTHILGPASYHYSSFMIIPVDDFSSMEFDYAYANISKSNSDTTLKIFGISENDVMDELVNLTVNRTSSYDELKVQISKYSFLKIVFSNDSSTSSSDASVLIGATFNN